MDHPGWHRFRCPPYWSCPVSVDGSKRSGRLCFGVVRADVSNVTMASVSVIEHLDVVEQIGTAFISRVITYTVRALSLE